MAVEKVDASSSDDPGSKKEREPTFE